MKMLKKLARSLAARYVCQNCEKEKNEGPWPIMLRNVWNATAFWPKAIRPRPSRSTASKKRWRKQSWSATLHGRC